MPASTIRPGRCASATAPARGGMLYDYCASHGVPHRKLGKLVVVGQRRRHSGAGEALRPGDAQRRRGPAHAGRRRGDAHGAGARLRRRVPFAGDRHHRQPPLHAGAAGRPRGPRRDAGVQYAGRAADAGVRRLGGTVRRQRARDAHRRRRRQFRRPRRPGAGARNRGLSARTRAADSCSPRATTSPTPESPPSPG